MDNNWERTEILSTGAKVYWGSINYPRFARIEAITSRGSEQRLIDRVLFHYQNTQLYRNGKRWFTRLIPHLGEMLNISERYVRILINRLVERGWLEKLRAKWYGVPRLFLRPTDKLLKVLGIEDRPLPPPAKKIYSQPTSAPSSESIKILKEEVNINNNKNNRDVSSNMKNEKTERNVPNIDRIEESLSKGQTTLLIDMFKNLKRHHGCQFSSPKEILEEAKYAITSPQQFSGITKFRHRVNILAKLIREKRWRTPKGFHNHSEAGAAVKAVRDLQDAESAKQHECPKYRYKNAPMQLKRLLQAAPKEYRQVKLTKRKVKPSKRPRKEELRITIMRLQEKMKTTPIDKREPILGVIARYREELYKSLKRDG